jgi:Predicted pyridoxal phosphate-dependent enzyme apparently involved in regulation of cell wall biogenesis
VSSSEVLPRLPLAEPSIGGNAAAYLAECLDSTYVSSIGAFVDRFEREFADVVGTRFAVACNSGTAALHLAFTALGVGPGDDVLVPTLTFVASANPVRYLGATPVLVDSEASTLNVDPGVVVDEHERRARAGLRQPRAIEVVHLVGHPADLVPILEVAARYGVPVIEDAAEALGASWKTGPLAGRQVGSAGLMGCFSFNGNKLITTGGGGMVTTDDESLARQVRHLSTQARVPGRVYDHDVVGFNYRLSNLAAALGVAQLEQLDELLGARRENALSYDAAIAALPGIEPAARADWADPSFWLYTARLSVSAAAERDRILDALGAAAIDARPIWSPLHRTQLYSAAPRLGGAVADRIFEAAISLPSSSTLRPADRERVVDGLARALHTLS